jgi:hypothetical protein
VEAEEQFHDEAEFSGAPSLGRYTAMHRSELRSSNQRRSALVYRPALPILLR